ncbi:AAA ATPase [Metarhizium acridum]|nr:AAA ATPase [Metarhizium acridum]
MNGAAGVGSARSVLQIMAGSLKSLTAETAPRASIGHLNKVTAAAFSNGTTQRLKTTESPTKGCPVCSDSVRKQESSIDEGVQHASHPVQVPIIGADNQDTI